MYHASPHLTYLLQTDLLKPDVSKLNYPLYPPWDWAEKSFRCYSHSANPLLTGVPAEGFGLLIVSARLQMFQPVKVRCYEISKTLKTVSRPIYNPQNEMFRLLGTKRSFSQNETFFFSHPYPLYPALFRLISHF